MKCYFLLECSLQRSRSAVMKQTLGHYPAPLKAIEVLEETLTMSLDEGLKVELEAFEPLATSPISKNLIELFFTSELLKKETFSKAQAKSIERSAVVGVGTMGSGIAWALANIDIPVRLSARKMESVATAISKIMQSFESIKKRGRLKSREIGLKMDRVTFTTKMQGNARYLDMAMVMGTGFPAFRGGLLRYADGEGLGSVVARLKVLEEQFGEHFTPASSLVEMVNNKQTIYGGV